MTQQTLLPGFEPEPELTDRIFFAVLPDAGAIARINTLTAELKAAHGMRGRAIADTRLHATLCNLGDFPAMPDSLVARAGQAAASVAGATAPFAVSFDTAQTFINRARNRPFVLTGGDGVCGLGSLYKSLAMALLKAGVHGNPPSYTPHLTLLYDDVTAPPQAAGPIEWTVRELVLVHSHIGQNLPYTALGRWSLQG
ncbi:2'-5' RNA ligase family protein [Duganella sp. HH105]|uniref:2'-5' RNA ligase family protein n=1 Tax=Duganella sp. HH105 TaxID=1781067 RepID=UPI000877D6A0|nr:2'-5' RNA ligase family protein [Duganella sp. HH105]OEZ63654.1 2',5' RNA ligase family [Duganella sp. HH105]